MGAAASQSDPTSDRASTHEETTSAAPDRIAYDGLLLHRQPGGEWAQRYGVVQLQTLSLWASEDTYRRHDAPLLRVALSGAAVRGPMSGVFVVEPLPPAAAPIALRAFDAEETETFVRKARMASREPWKADALECFLCGDEFDFGTRHHHCRRCGESVCDPCSPSREPLTLYAYAEPVRVCVACKGHPDAHRLGVRV
jgi:hypothetical protein